MLVSIITPSYNQGEYLEDTILSVLNQDYPEIEYIVIDGGSSDNSVDVILKYAERISYWVSEPDKGQADAINKGFRKSRGNLICWINSDDLLYPDFVSTRVKQFLNNPGTDFIYGDVDQGISPGEKRLRKGAQTDYKKMLISLNVPVPQQSAMWRRNLVDRVGPLDEQWQVILDREYFMRIARSCAIKYIPGPVAFFRNHERSKSVEQWRKWADELERYYNDLFSSGSTPEYEPLKSRALSRMYFTCAKICEDCNDLPDRKRYLALSKAVNRSCYLKLGSLNAFRHYFLTIKKKLSWE